MQYIKTRIKVEIKENGETSYYPQVCEYGDKTRFWSVITIPFKIMVFLGSAEKGCWWIKHYLWEYILINLTDDFADEKYRTSEWVSETRINKLPITCKTEEQAKDWLNKYVKWFEAKQKAEQDAKHKQEQSQLKKVKYLKYHP